MTKKEAIQKFFLKRWRDRREMTNMKLEVINDNQKTVL